MAYIRVSSTGQNLNAQRDAVLAAGAERVFEEKRSGIDQSRPVMAECVRYLREGDTFIVTKADRIARSSAHLLKTLDDLSKQGVSVEFIDQPQLNTGDKYGKFMLTVLSGVAELEREIIRERQQDGIKAAQKRGVKFGRKPKLTDDLKQTIRRLKADGAPISVIKERTGMSKSSIYVALQG